MLYLYERDCKGKCKGGIVRGRKAGAAGCGESELRKIERIQEYCIRFFKIEDGMRI